MQDLPKWKRFELLVKSIQEQLSPNAIVSHNEMILGKTGTRRQIDILVRTKIGQFDVFIVIECKDYNKPVNVKTVEEFAGLIEDIQATKGAIITYHGFTSSAKKKAEIKGIDLYRLLDTQSVDWPVILNVPVICNLRGLKDYQVIFSSAYDAPAHFPYGDGVRELLMYQSDSTVIGTIEDHFTLLWNKDHISRDAGIHEHTLEKVYLRDEELFFPMDITYKYEIDDRFYLGEIAIDKLMGFLDEKTGAILTNELVISGRIDINEVERKWLEIKKGEVDDINYLFMFGGIESYYRRL